MGGVSFQAVERGADYQALKVRGRMALGLGLVQGLGAGMRGRKTLAWRWA